MKTAREIIDSQLTERAFQAMIVQLARATGWLCYHTFESRQVTSRGFPDLVLCKHKVIYAELKTERGRLRPEQRVWLSTLQEAGVDARCWRPSDWIEIEATLRG